MKFASRLDRFGKEIFTLLDEKKSEVEQTGRKIYNMSIGTPDFEPPSYVKEALQKAADEPNAWKYPLYDLPELLDAVCGYYKRRYRTDILPEEITSVCGTQTGLGYVCLALCDPGDVVLLPDPCYPGFEAAAYMADAKICYYPLLEENGFLPDVSGIDEETAKQAKLIIVNLPSNPVGAVAEEGFYDKLIAWAGRYDVCVVHDNAYSDIIYDGSVGRSFLSFPGAKEVGVEFFSMSKSFNVTGARIGFLIGRKDVVDAVRLFREHVDFGMFIPLQRAAIAALSAPADDVLRQCAVYEERRDIFCEGLRELGWDVPDSKGSMFVWAPLPEGYTDSMAFCLMLLEQAGVLCAPGASFGPHGEGFVRFALVIDKEELKGALAAIRASGLFETF